MELRVVETYQVDTVLRDKVWWGAISSQLPEVAFDCEHGLLPDEANSIWGPELTGLDGLGLLNKTESSSQFPISVSRQGANYGERMA